jgi:hypothetical protein
MGQVWGGLITFDNQNEQFMAAISEFNTMEQNDTIAAILPYIFTTNNTVAATFFYSEPTPYPPALAPFWKLNATIDETAVRSYQNLTSLPIQQNGIDRCVFRVDFSSILDLVSKYCLAFLFS